VAADRHQAAADECDIRCGVQRRKLAHRVDQHHVCRARSGRAAAAPREGHVLPTQQIGHAVESVRVPRHQQQQSVGPLAAQPRVRRQHLFFLARVGAAGNPHRPFGAEFGAQLAASIERRRVYLQIEFDVADHMGLSSPGPDGDEALRVLGALNRELHGGGEYAAKQVPEALVARNGFRRQAGTGEQQRHAAPRALVKQVGPELGLHDDGELRPGAIQESRHGTRCVVRQEAHLRVGEQGPSTRPSGRRRSGQHQRILRIARAQCTHQRCRRRHLS